jgi:hypothetical protein
MAITGEVAGGHATGKSADTDDRGTAEGAGACAQNDGCVVRDAICRNQVQVAIIIEVGDW